MITLDEAGRLFLERSLRSQDPAVVVDIFDPSDSGDNYPESVHPVYARHFRQWLDPETGLLRVEATLDALDVTSISVPATPMHGDLVFVDSWTVTPVDPFSGLRGTVNATGWIPELVGHPSSRNSKSSPYEASGKVVGALSALLKSNAGPWTANYANIRVTAEPVQSSPGAFRVKVSVGQTPITASALLVALTPAVGKLVVVNVGTLTTASAFDTNTVAITVS